MPFTIYVLKIRGFTNEGLKKHKYLEKKAVFPYLGLKGLFCEPGFEFNVEHNPANVIFLRLCCSWKLYIILFLIFFDSWHPHFVRMKFRGTLC